MKLPPRAACLVALAALMLVSCAEPVRVVETKSQPYAATTPRNVVKAFEWAVNHRDLDALSELFTEDFVLIGATTDSAGNPYRDVIGRRDDLLRWFRCLLEGGGVGDPPPASIRLTFGRNLIPLPDPRPGYTDSLDKTIRTSVNLKVELDDGTRFEVTGYALFFITRGDTAAIPADLASRGFQKDERRWWISRWEDETIESGGTDPASALTIGALLKAYDCRRYFRPAP